MSRQFQFQVIATTHSLETVDAIALSAGNDADDLVVFNLDQSGKETRINRMPGELLLRLRKERGLDVR